MESISQINNEQKNERKQIKKLKHEIHINNIHSEEVRCLIMLQDKRIVTGSSDKSISICSFDIFTTKWELNIHKPNAHNNSIYSLCELASNILISSSEDKSIKLWNIDRNDLQLIKILIGHKNVVNKVISLPKQKFASCSLDRTIKIWDSQKPYQELSNLKDDDSIWSILHLNNRELLVSSCYSYPSPSISFWNSYVYKKEHSIRGYYASIPSHIMEFPNGKIAVSDSYTIGYPVIIIDVNNYTVIKKIKVLDISYKSSLCLLDCNSFIYSYERQFVQISNENYSVMFKSHREIGIRGMFGIVSVCEGKFIVVDNKYNGVTVISVDYGEENKSKGNENKV